MNKFIIYIIIIIISEIDLYYINASNVDEYSDCHRDDLKWPPLPGVYRNNAYHIRKNGITDWTRLGWGYRFKKPFRRTRVRAVLYEWIARILIVTGGGTICILLSIYLALGDIPRIIRRITFIYVILLGLPLPFFNIAQDEYSCLSKYADWLINLFYNKIL